MPIQDNRAAPGEDGSVRKSHYGDGEQPWDTIKRMGFAAQFAAGNVLKYVRRTKDPEHSLESARWYYAQLKAMMKRDVEEGAAGTAMASYIYKVLMGELKDAELAKLV